MILLQELIGNHFCYQNALENDLSWQNALQKLPCLKLAVYVNSLFIYFFYQNRIYSTIYIRFFIQSNHYLVSENIALKKIGSIVTVDGEKNCFIVIITLFWPVPCTAFNKTDTINRLCRSNNTWIHHNDTLVF